MEDDPGFTFEVGGVVAAAEVFIGVDLDGEIGLGVEEFDEEGKVAVQEFGGAHDGGGIGEEQVAEGLIFVGAVGDEVGEGAIGCGTGGIFFDGAGGEVGEFPGFADGIRGEGGGDRFGEDGFEA